MHLLDFFVFPQALEHSPPLCGVQQMPLSYSPQMISPAALPAGACISSSDNLEAQLSLQKCVVKKNKGRMGVGRAQTQEDPERPFK